MVNPQFKVGDQVRVITARHPDSIQVGIIQSITPTPDNTGNLLYALLLKGTDPKTAEILVVDSPGILLMEYELGTRRGDD